MIRIEKLTGRWSVRAAGAVIAESNQVLELREGDYPPVLYFPRGDIAMALLDQTDKTSHCPHKGDATYFTVQTKSGPIENAAWSYDAPAKGVAKIEGHLSFYANDKIAVEEV